MKKDSQKTLKRPQNQKRTKAKKPDVKAYFRHHKVFIAFIALVIIVIALMMMNNKYSSPGFYGHLAIPGRFLIANCSQFVGGVGMSIILLTIIVRLVLMPLMIRQSKMSTMTQAMQQVYKPQMDGIKKSYAKAKQKAKQAKTKKERKKYLTEAGRHSDELRDFVTDHHIGIKNMGCGTIFLQFPIFAMLYACIRNSPEIQKAHFLGIALGKSSVVLAGLAFVFYMINSFIIKHGQNKRKAEKGNHPATPKNDDKPKSEMAKKMDANSSGMMNMMIFSMPFWIGFISLSTSAGLTLYFCVGGLFVIGQQLYLQKIMPGVRKHAHEKVKSIKRRKRKVLRKYRKKKK